MDKKEMVDFIVQTETEEYAYDLYGEGCGTHEEESEVEQYEIKREKFWNKKTLEKIKKHYDELNED